MVVKVLLIIVGFVLLIKGADFLVDGSSKVAKKFHIPEIIIGLTIVSIGTSMPELFVSITSAINGYSDMAIGNVIGSNICNLLLILGLSAVIKPVIFQRETRLIEIPMCLVLTIIFWVLCSVGGGVSLVDAIILIVLFGIFIGYTIFMGLSSGEALSLAREKRERDKLFNGEMVWSIISIIGGIVALKFGGDFVVDGAVFIAREFKISEAVISLTILAIGTSLPELVTSVTAAFKGNSDIAIGNIIGSNIFNMLLIVGVSAAIKPIQYNVMYNIEMIILLVAVGVLALFPFIPPKNEMSRKNGLVYLVLYVGYMIVLFNIQS